MATQGNPMSPNKSAISIRFPRDLVCGKHQPLVPEASHRGTKKLGSQLLWNPPDFLYKKGGAGGLIGEEGWVPGKQDSPPLVTDTELVHLKYITAENKFPDLTYSVALSVIWTCPMVRPAELWAYQTHQKLQHFVLVETVR